MLQRIIDILDPCETTFRLLESFLLGREVCTSIGGVNSTFGLLKSGLPQGSSLSSLLFSFLFASLPTLNTFGKMILFADDIQMLYQEEPSKEQMLENRLTMDFEMIKDYLGSIYMKANSSKTVLSRYGSIRQLSKANPNFSFRIGGEIIKVQNGTRNLGLFMDENLSFRRHFDLISRQCSAILYHLRAIRLTLTEKHAKMLVNSLIISKIRLFIPLTITASQKDLMVLQKIVNHCIRLIHQKRKFDHIEVLKNNYYWGDIKNLADIEFNKLVKDMLNGRSSAFLNNLIIEGSYNRTRRVNYVCKTFKTGMGQKTMIYRASKLLNSEQSINRSAI